MGTDLESGARKETALYELTNHPEINLATQGALPAVTAVEGYDLTSLEGLLEQRMAAAQRSLTAGSTSVIGIGRGRFELVDSGEAVLIRRERESESPYRPSGLHLLPAALHDELVVFSTVGTSALGSRIAAELGIDKGALDLKQFKDGELSLKVGENVRDRDVFVVAGTSAPVNEQLMELFITVDAMKRASAGRVTVVMPYSGYARQDRKLKGREPISAKLVAKLLESAGVDRVVTVDVHSDQTIGFFNIPVDNLRAASVLLPHLRRRFARNDLIIVSPDKGGVTRAGWYASELNAPLAMIHKERGDANSIERMTVLGDVRGKTCLLIDDMADTAGTLIKAADELKLAGAERVAACVVHSVLSGDAMERLRASHIEEVITTDTIPLRRARGTQVTVVSVAGLIAEAIKRMAMRESLSELSKLELDDGLRH